MGTCHPSVCGFQLRVQQACLYPRARLAHVLAWVSGQEGGHREGHLVPRPHPHPRGPFLHGNVEKITIWECTGIKMHT